jgi:hypothetical protein
MCRNNFLLAVFFLNNISSSYLQGTGNERSGRIKPKEVYA